VHHKSLTYITNDVLTSERECAFDMFALDLHRPRHLAKCKLYSALCSKHPPKRTYFVTKYCAVVKVLTICIGRISANVSCVKPGPASLKSLCVNKLKVYQACTVHTFSV
jgi:hypothetical protein